MKSFRTKRPEGVTGMNKRKANLLAMKRLKGFLSASQQHEINEIDRYEADQRLSANQTQNEQQSKHTEKG